MPEDISSDTQGVTPETPLETAQRVLEHVNKTKAWALAKVDTIERRIADAGGEPAAALAEAITAVRATAQ